MVAEAAILTPLGWLVSPLITMIFNKAHDHLGTGIDERRKILAATVLPRLSLAIEKAEKSPNKEKLVHWLNRLKGAYYEAEEAIDLFEYQLLKEKVNDDRKTLEQKEKSKRGTRISLPSQIVPQKLKDSFSVFSQKKIKLKDSIDKLIEIAKEANQFRDLLEVQDNGSGSDTDRETISENHDRVYGRDVDKENIVGLLTEKPSNSELSIPIVIKNMIEIIVALLMIKPINSEPGRRTRPVIPIVIKYMIKIIAGVLMKKPLNSESGPTTRPIIPIFAIMGRSGIGKTALAQIVYKHMDGQKDFDLHVWVHAPRKFNATNMIKNMIEIIRAKECNPNNNTSTSLEALLTQIRSMLVSKKLLLVIDDFWSDSEDFFAQWDNFIFCLSSCSPGSRILLTTQSKKAAEQAGIAGVTEVKTYYLRDIEEDQFSELFMHYAWPSNCHFQKEEFKKIGRKIAVKLKGDPGAAKLVGRQLSGKLDPRHWEEVAEKDWLGDNMKARIWSYQQLPPDLQRCFAICSLFPKGTKLPGPLLIGLWMAEGYIRSIDKKQRLEDIGENYLYELVSRFFFEQCEVEEIKNYQLHDLLHDLAEHVQGDDFIRIESTYFKEIPSHINHMLSRSENIRHIYLPSCMINELKEKLCLMKNVCTFCVQSDGGFVPKKVLQEILENKEKLRVLRIPDCGDDLPDTIGNLKHLRYLNVNVSRPLKKLPDSICKLYHLQTLVLPNCQSIPKDFSKLISLRRLYTDDETISHISQVGRLTCLQGLGQFVVRKGHGYELHQLENLNQVRGEMHITGLENVGSIEDVVKANMQKKKYLEKLGFEWNSDERDNDDITGLSTQHIQLLDALKPHCNISVLILTGFGGYSFPNWLLNQNFLKHLTQLVLLKCNKVEEISSIGKSLTNCKVLKLCWLKNLKQITSLPPNLTTLVMHSIPQLSYFSENDLLMKEEKKKSKFEVVKQIAECLKKKYVHLPMNVLLTTSNFFMFMKGKLEVAPEICVTGSQYETNFSEIVKFDLATVNFDHNGDYPRDQLWDAWVMFMYCHIETMFTKNEESKLVLPSSLTYLEISSCSITSEALSSCIQCLVSLSKLKLSDIQTITSLPPRKILCSLKNLQSLTIEGCFLLNSLGGIGALTSLIVLELHCFLNLNTSNETLPSSLERLRFWNCTNVDVVHALDVGNLCRLKELFIAGWDGCLEGLNSLTTLHSLYVWDCPEINPSSTIDKDKSALLRVVSVDNLLVLKLILSSETISSLDALCIYKFKEGSSDDEIFQSLSSLKELYFDECSITHFPKNLKNLASLQYMSLKNCPNLCGLEELPRNLRKLEIKGCPSLMLKFNKGGPYQVWFQEGSTFVISLTEEEMNQF